MHRWNVNVQFASGETETVEVKANWNPEYALIDSLVRTAGVCQAKGKRYAWGSGGRPPEASATSTEFVS